MYKIIIIGAGFAGLSAASRLSRCNLELQVTIFDKKESSDFLPLVPDAVGRELNPKLLACKITDLLLKGSSRFIKEEVISLDLESKHVVTSNTSYAYDFLVIASGSQTNFFGNQNAQNYAYGLNSVNDAINLRDALKDNSFDNFIICGGGYTGIEAASNLWLYLEKKGVASKIVIVERSPEILGLLPAWMKSYVRNNLKSMGIEIMANSVIENIQQCRVLVSGNRIFEKAMLIWVPGVRTADFVSKLAVEKNPQGRIVVDEYLRFRRDCFCAGDTAFFIKENNPLRMAAQFAIAEGAQAADNITRCIRKLSLKKFRPRDLGYIIPMANNKSCGKVFGISIKGFFPTLLHFTMCIYLSPGLRNKTGLIINLIRGCKMLDWGILVLRLALGIMFIAHGLQMAFGLFGGSGIKAFSGMLSGLGFVPAMFWAYIGAYTVLIGGLLIIVGVQTRLAAILLLIFILTAGIRVHLGKGFFLSNGGFEYTFIIAAICLALILLGPGKFNIFSK